MERLLVALGSLALGGAVAFGAATTRRATPREASAVAGEDATARTGGASSAAPGPVRPSESAGAAPGAPSDAPVGPAAPSAAGEGGFGWDALLAYDYQPGLGGLPDALRALDGKRVTLRGFLMPLLEWDDIHEFSLVQTHMSCCFGQPPGVTGQVLVKLTAKRGLPNTNEPIEVTGTFRVGEVKEEGFVLAVFSMLDASARILGY